MCDVHACFLALGMRRHADPDKKWLGEGYIKQIKIKKDNQTVDGQTFEWFVKSIPKISNRLAAIFNQVRLLASQSLIDDFGNGLYFRRTMYDDSARWCPPVISWFIIPINYRYNPHKP